MGTASAPLSDPLLILREYRQLAPWSLRDLAMVSAAILEASAIRPINAAASAHPNQRTIRFYVTRGIVAAPEGRGTAAVYSYRHLLQVLAIKLRQMEGGTLAAIARELTDATGDMLERRVASALGPGLPLPQRLAMSEPEVPPRGRGRAGHQYLGANPASCHRAGFGRPHLRHLASHPHRPGLELHVHHDHPLADHTGRESEIADAVHAAVTRLLAE